MYKNIISDVIYNMKDDLSFNQKEKLKNFLQVNLQKYKITEESQPSFSSSKQQIIDKSWKKDLKRFLERKELSGKSESTIKRYDYILNKALSSINKPINEITDSDLNDYIQEYKTKNGVSNSTLQGVRRCLSSFFTFQHERGFIDKNPVSGVDPIKCPKVLKKAFTDEQLEKIKINCGNVRDLAMVEFLYSTGVRVSQLCALNIVDIDFKNRQVVINGKGNKERVVYLTPISNMYLNIYLKERKDKNKALFVSMREPFERLNPGGIRAALNRIGDKAGVENVHPHRYHFTLFSC